MRSEIEKGYRFFISRELQARKRRRSGYSLRAFARDLNMPAPKLSQVLSGTCGISRERGALIAESLGLPQDERELFLCQIEAEHSRSPKARLQAQKKLITLDEKDDFGPLALDRFKIISDWYHSALLELPQLKRFRSDPKWISNRLGVDKSKIESAIERLLDFGMFIRNKDTQELERTKNHLATPSGISAKEIREHHSQILSKADQALETFPISQRDFSAITMAIDSSRLEEAREKLKEFRREFCKDIQKSKNKDRVYCLSIQFFPLDKGDTP